MGTLYAFNENGSVFIKGYIANICNDDQGKVYYLQHDFENMVMNMYMTDSLFSQTKLIAVISRKNIHKTFDNVNIAYDKKKKQIHVSFSIFHNQRLEKVEVFDLYIRNDRYSEFDEKDLIKNKKLSDIMSKKYNERKYYQLGLSDKTNEMKYDEECFFYDQKCSQSGNNIAILEEEMLPENELKQTIYLCDTKGKIIKKFQNQFIYINIYPNSRFTISNNRIYIFPRYSMVCNYEHYHRLFVFDLNGNPIFHDNRDPLITEIYDSLQRGDLSLLDDYMSQLADSSIAISEEEFKALPEDIQKVYLLYEELLSSTDYETKITHKNNQRTEEIKGKYEIIPQNLTYLVSRDSSLTQGFYSTKDKIDKFIIKNIKPRVKSTKRVIYLNSANDLFLTQALPESKLELLEELFNSTQTQLGPFHIRSNGEINIIFNSDMTLANISIYRSDVGSGKSYRWEKDRWIRQ